MIPRPPRSTRPDTLLPSTTLCRSRSRSSCLARYVSRRCALPRCASRPLRSSASRPRSLAHGRQPALAHCAGERLVFMHAGVGIADNGGEHVGDIAGGIAFPAEMPGHSDLVDGRSEEHTSELQSLMRNSYAVFCLKKKKTHN